MSIFSFQRYEPGSPRDLNQQGMIQCARKFLQLKPLVGEIPPHVYTHYEQTLASLPVTYQSDLDTVNNNLLLAVMKAHLFLLEQAEAKSLEGRVNS